MGMLGGRKRGAASVGAAVEEGPAPKRWSSPRSGSRAGRVVAASASVAVASYGDDDDDEADDNDDGDDMRGVDVDDDIEGLLGLSAEQLAKVEEREGLTAEAVRIPSICSSVAVGADCARAVPLTLVCLVVDCFRPQCF